MYPLSEHYLQSPCEVKTLTNELLTTGAISEVLQASVKIHNNFDILPILHCNMQVKLNIYNETSGFKVLIGKVFLSTPEMMQITDLQALAEFEKRSFFRLKVSIHTQASLLQEDSVSEEEEQRSFDITVTDLSLNGLFIRTTEYLDLGQSFIIMLNLYDMDIPFCCQVQRVNTVDDFYNGYGCSFLDNSTRQFDLLSKFIFEKQREQIKNSREEKSGQ
ncbi:PilZ domain-containing protein [Caproiciproducens faecalis]|uniref:PilZ domain-containing protein n=1 Tax=Caproiciproducens faecalis TaxID=2820301 RepID=A0ABS7DRD3_9FIRM|nr:PilZ domain-containing protein [Caproiciproducens faecalis]MBW7573380.1 PilZ domain-containing protein [Caproiciproducens faecalis]